MERFTSKKTEMITGPFYTISSNTFHQRKCFVFVMSVIIWESRMSQRPRDRAATVLVRGDTMTHFWFTI